MGVLSTVRLDIIIEFFLILVLFSDKITKSKTRLRVGIGIFFISNILLFVLPIQDLIFGDILIVMVITFLVLEEKWYEKIVSFLLAYILASLLYQAFALILDFVLGLPVFVGMNSIKEKNMIKVFLILGIIFFLIVKMKIHYNFSLSFTNKIFLCVYTGILCIVLTLFHLNQNLINDDFLNLFAMLCIVSIGIIIAYMLSSSARNLNLRELYSQKQYVDFLKGYYNEVKKNNIEIRKLKHDMKNHINILGNLIDSGYIDKATNYMHEINDYVSKQTTAIVDTGNVLVNAILLQKKYEFPNINLIFIGFVNNDIPIKNYDLCTILNNLLDNAFEYSLKNGLQTVKLFIYQENSVLLINVVNELIMPVDTSTFNKTTKTDYENHGYGLTIVKEIVNHYQGIFEYLQDKSQLIAKVQLLL